jgi:drug/metabolite transporter (DMT)-like permease
MNRLALSVLLLGIVAVWGWTFVLVKDAVEVYGVVPFLAVRFAIGTACIGLFVGRRTDGRTWRAGGWIGVVLAVAYLTQTVGLDHSTATNTGLITGLFIVFAPLANRLLFGVRTTPLLWGAIAISLVGLALLTGAAADGLAGGDWFTLGCAASFGLHVALLDRYSKGHRAGPLVLAQLLAATCIFAGVWMISEPLRWPPAEVWPALLVTALVATSLGYFVQTFVQQRLSAVETAMVILTEPLFAVAFGYMLHGDRLSGLQILGGVLMVAALFATELYPLLRPPSSRQVDDERNPQ